MSYTATVPPTLAQFQAQFPEFTNDPATYAPSVITAYLGVFGNMMDPNVWGELYTLGVSLAVAHMLVLDAQDARAAANGGVPGVNGGVISSKSAGPLSASYDTTVGSENDAGMWNLTTYGRRWYHFAMIVGGGGQMQFGGDPSAIRGALGNWFPGSSYPGLL